MAALAKTIKARMIISVNDSKGRLCEICNYVLIFASFKAGKYLTNSCANIAARFSYSASIAFQRQNVVRSVDAGF